MEKGSRKKTSQPSAAVISETNVSEQGEKSPQLLDFSSFLVLDRLVQSSDPIGNILRPLNEYLRSKQTEILGDEYHVIYLWDTQNQITEFTADRLYASLKTFARKKLLLILHSHGGQIEPAYLMSRCCRERAGEHFFVAVPRRAKSAATLLALGASEIHMGDMSELGPIDPQMNGLPALGLQNAMDSLASLASTYPGASEMLSKYLSTQLSLPVLGYFDRISRSAEQYAERLLTGLPDARKVAHRFVYDYLDHSFVIGRSEAEEILGDRIKTNTKEYAFASMVHEILENMNLLLRLRRGMQCYFVGSEFYDLYISDIPKKEG